MLSSACVEIPVDVGQAHIGIPVIDRIVRPLTAAADGGSGLVGMFVIAGAALRRFGLRSLRMSDGKFVCSFFQRASNAPAVAAIARRLGCTPLPAVA